MISDNCLLFIFSKFIFFTWHCVLGGGVLKNAASKFSKMSTLYAPIPQNGQTHSNNSNLSVSNHFMKLALKELKFSWSNVTNVMVYCSDVFWLNKTNYNSNENSGYNIMGHTNDENAGLRDGKRRK